MKVIIELEIEELQESKFRKNFYKFFEFNEVIMSLQKLNIDNRDIKIQNLRAEFAGTKRKN